MVSITTVVDILLAVQFQLKLLEVAFTTASITTRDKDSCYHSLIVEDLASFKATVVVVSTSDSVMEITISTFFIFNYNY